MAALPPAAGAATGSPAATAASTDRDPRDYPGLPIAVDARGWERLERGEVVVELQEVAGSAVKRGVAIALIDVPAERLYGVVTDNARFAEFMPHVDRVDGRSSAGRLDRQRPTARPAPGDRPPLPGAGDRTRSDEEDGWKVRRSAWSYVPGSGNIVESRGSWTLVELGERRTLLLYEVFTDPGGWIPAWLYNQATRKTLPDLIASVRPGRGRSSRAPAQPRRLPQRDPPPARSGHRVQRGQGSAVRAPRRAPAPDRPPGRRRPRCRRRGGRCRRGCPGRRAGRG